MKEKYYSEAARAIHESAKDLFEAGAISEAEMMDFDKRCMLQKPKTHEAKKPVKTEPFNYVTA